MADEPPRRVFPQPDRIDLCYVAAVSCTATAMIVAVLSGISLQQGPIDAVLRRVVPVLAYMLVGLCPAGMLIQILRRRLPSLPMLMCWVAASVFASLLAVAVYFNTSKT